MRRKIKIRRKGFVEKLSDNILAKFQPNINWSKRRRLKIQNAFTTSQNFHFEKQPGKIAEYNSSSPSVMRI